jgi:thermitase
MEVSKVNRMCNFERHLVVTVAITMILVANTLNTTFNFLPLRKTQSLSESLNNDVKSQISQSNSNLPTSSKEMQNGWSESSLLDLWKSGVNTSESSLNGVSGISDYLSKDNDSMELVIGVNSALPKAYEDIINKVGDVNGKIVNTVSARGKTFAIVVDVPLDAGYSLMNDIQASNLAQYIEPNREFQAQLVPNDQYWSLQWGPQKIEADWAWNTTTGVSSVLVAVIDTGIDYTHPDLADNYVALGYNWVSNTNDPLDDNGHGTHCAGIIAAVLNNTLGIAGLAQVKIMAEKALDASGSGYEDDLANAIIDAVDKGAKILSNSWGASTGSMLVHEAVQYAYNHGVLVIAAAGNNGNYAKFYPAAYNEVVAVTATGPSDAPTSFTNYGDWVEVAAPGVNIYSTLPTYPCYLTKTHDKSIFYDYLSGTSMACPHAAGVAALIWSQFPNASQDWVRARLRYTADDLGSSGFDVYYGYGRINAKNAVEQAPPNHDLLILDVETPRYVQPGDIVLLNATVLNFGTNNEENVIVKLLVEGNLTDSTTISYLTSLTSTTVSLLWNPLAEGIYNVTLSIVPVSDETNIENNVITEMISVKHVLGFVLFDQTRCEPIDWYSEWVANLTERGYVVDAYSADYITPDVLSGYDVFIVPAAVYAYAPDEISAIQDFVLDGGGLLVISEYDPPIYYDPSIYSALTSFAGITWGVISMWCGTTHYITPHDVTKGVSTAYFGSSRCELFVSSPAEGLIRDSYGNGHILLAVSEVGAGRVIGISDSETVMDPEIEYVDNLRLANNMIDWLLGTRYEHELTVRLGAPSYLLPGESTLLNVTIYNRGLQNETDVELRLLINGTLTVNTTIPLLESDTKYTINYTWTPPSVVAVYNVTAYAIPVLLENITINNVKTKLVGVQYPLINPEPGQYANYIINLYYNYSSEHGIYTYLVNFTYEYYVEPYKIYITVRQKTPDGRIATDWMTVNTMNRFVESGAWGGVWYPGWIETNVNVGSTINLLGGAATVNGTKIFRDGPRAIELWDIPYDAYDLPYDMCYDKASGLWFRMEILYLTYGLTKEELILTNTNIPVGIQYEHDLGVTLEAPQELKPGDSSTLSAKVYNLGLNDESNVMIRILINGTEVASTLSATLANGTWYTLDYCWTPTKEGFYNVTVEASPVTGENVTINNIASEIVHVRFVEVALISDYSELTDIAPILESVGIGCDIYNNNEMHLYTENLSLLLNYKAVVLYKDSRGITSNEYSVLESYLSSGGSLLVTGLDSLTHDTLLAHLVRSSSIGDDPYQYDLIVIANEHPIMNGPYGSFPSGYHITGLYWDCDSARADTAQGAVKVAKLADEYDRIIATDGLPGKVVFWNGAGTYDWTMNSDCETMLKNLIHWFLVHITVSVNLSVGSPEAEVRINGSGATLDGTVSIYWDDILAGNTTTNGSGDFAYLLTVPEDALIGIHEIKAIDISANTTASAFFRLIRITLNPPKSSIGTKVTITGSGFTPSVQAAVTFNDMLMGYAYVDSFGNFTFILNVPLSAAGVQTIKAFETEGNYAFAVFTVVDVTPLDVTVDVGAIHFLGEVAEFYAQAAFKGVAINATSINTILYKPNGATESLSAQLIATGLYRIPYTILGNETGTYTLVVTISIVSGTVESNGTCFKCFLVSSTLALMNNRVIEIKDGLALVQNDLSFVKLNLTAMNITLQSIFLKVISINGTTATIQTMIGVMNGTVTEIDGNMATIVTPIGNIEADVSSLVGTQQTWVIPQYAVIIIALIAAVSSALTLFFVRRRRTVEVR